MILLGNLRALEEQAPLGERLRKLKNSSVAKYFWWKMIYNLPINRFDALNKKLSSRNFSPVLAVDLCPDINKQKFSLLIERASAALRRHNELRPTIQAINIYLLEAETINACAIKSDSEYCICINAGFFESLERIFSAIISGSNLLNFFGIMTPAENVPALSIGRPFINDSLSMNLDTVSQDTRDLASIFSTICFDFITYHEYAHVMIGHLGYLVPKGSDFFALDEISRSIEDMNMAFSRRVLEHDADAFAAIQSYGNAEYTNLWNKTEITSIIFSQHEQRYRATHIAIITLFLILHIISGQKNDNPKNTHPPLGWRSMYGLGALAEAACRKTGNDHKKYGEEILIPSLKSVLKFFLTGDESIYFLQTLRGYYTLKPYYAIEERWAEMVPELKKYKLSPSFNIDGSSSP